MKLRRLTGLERDKIEAELAALLAEIAYLKEILASDKLVYEIIKKELLEIKNKYADERRTTIDMTAIDYIEDESLIPVEDSVITLTNNGYIKRMTSDTYKTQNRGGVGIKGMATNEEDFVKDLINTTTHDYVLFFTNKGRVYRIKGYEIPSFSRQSKGLPIINLLSLDQDEKVKVMLKVTNEDNNKFVLFCTQKGLIKKTPISEFENIRTNGKIAITLKEDDQLISVNLTTGEDEILIASSNGRMVRFNEKELRIMGRTASGVRGINLGSEICVGCEVTSENSEVLVVTEKGYGKKTNVNEYRLTHRGSKGVKALNITDKNGKLVSFKLVKSNEDLIIITNNGVVIRMDIDQISQTGRVAQGVRLINLKEENTVSNATLVQKDIVEEETNTN